MSSYSGVTLLLSDGAEHEKRHGHDKATLYEPYLVQILTPRLETAL
jgi:hypothetical protein